MSLIIATGSNLGDRKDNLKQAKDKLSELFHFVAESRIYSSPAIEYLDQPEFYNQVIEFQLPKQEATQVMKQLLEVEQSLGRKRDIPKGPRLIDIDIIFWGIESINADNLIVPHPAWQDRSFVTLPLKELPYYETIKKSFIIPTTFNNSAEPIS